MYTDATKIAIRKAVMKVSKKYRGNIIFDRKPERVRIKRNWVRFTIKTQDKTKKPSRISANGRLVYKASWQAHGEIMEEIFKFDPKATVIETAIGSFKPGFKWADVDIRSEDQIEAGVKPILYSKTTINKPVHV